MISLTQLKKLLDQPNMPDKEARVVLNTLYGLAELIIEDLQSKRTYGPIQKGEEGEEMVENRELPASSR